MDATILERILKPMKKRIQLMLGRAVLAVANDSKGIQTVQITVLADEVLDNVPRVQNYGLTSKPLPGAEAFVAFVNGSRDQGVVIAIDDRRFRLKNLADGEVALYTDEGDKIHFKRGNKIDVVTGELTATASVKTQITSPVVQVDAATSVTINSPDVKINAPTKVQVTSPQVEIIAATQVTATTPFFVVTGLIQCAGIAAGGAAPVSGKAIVQGSVEVTGTIESGGAIKSTTSVEDPNGTMQEMRGIYNAHKHTENNGGGGNPFTNTPDTPMV